MTDPILVAEEVSRHFDSGGGTVHACRDVTFSLAPGELVVLRGASGSGKTTLLNLLAGIDRPDSGRVLVDGRDLATMSERDLVATRRADIGYVFQSFGLIPILSAAENVEVPLRAVATPAAERDARVAEVLDLVGMAGHAGHRPEELSGGQQQRVGIARALANSPRILLADEPTGQLDAATAERVMDMVVALCEERGLAALVATHDPDQMARAHRIVEMHDGRLDSPGRHRAATG